MPDPPIGLRPAHERGRRAEDAAADHLVKAGWRIVDRNVRVGHLEVDLIAQRGSVIAIVEVRFRGVGSWQGALESVDAAKRERLRTAARRLWDQRLRHDATIHNVRFDIAVVSFAADGSPSVEHIEAAFQ